MASNVRIGSSIHQHFMKSEPYFCQNLLKKPCKKSLHRQNQQQQKA